MTKWRSFLISSPLGDLTESLMGIELFIWSANPSAFFRKLPATITQAADQLQPAGDIRRWGPAF